MTTQLPQRGPSFFFTLLIVCIAHQFLFTIPLTAESKKITALREQYNVNVQQSPDSYIHRYLSLHHLINGPSPFTYEYKTELYNGLLGQSIALPEKFEQIAHKCHAHLDNAFFFKDVVMFKKNPELTRRYLMQPRPGTGEKISVITATTRDGQIIEGIHFDRGSSTLVVVGSGFTNAREEMAPFCNLFEHDMLFFDYRGHGITQGNGFQPQSIHTLIKKLFGIDPEKVKLGLHEELDVVAIVNEAKRQKKYAQVIGLGICYSATIFAKTEACYPGTFSKLILDGILRSLGDTVERLSRDMKLLVSPQRGGWSKSWISKNQYSRRFIIWFAEKLFSMKFNSFSILDYTPELRDVPVLFFHGKDDLMSSRAEFESVWQSVPSRTKTAVITSNPHVWNHLKEKEVYTELCELFISQTYESFTYLVSNPVALAQYKGRELRDLIG